MDYKNYIEMMHKLELINKDINRLYNRQIEIRMSLLPSSPEIKTEKISGGKVDNETLNKMSLLEDINNTIIQKKELREEILERLHEIEQNATDKFKFKIFILRWFQNKSYRYISRVVPMSKDTIKRTINEIKEEIMKDED